MIPTYLIAAEARIRAQRGYAETYARPPRQAKTLLARRLAWLTCQANWCSANPFVRSWLSS